MKKVELYKGIFSSQLGFGCAPILGSVDAGTAKKAMEVALDCGINHFDLARSYGYGEAEKFVGKILAGKRDQVVLATKFGIKANWKAAFLKPLKPIVRMIKKGKMPTEKAPGLQEGSNEKVPIADLFHDRIPLTGKSMVASLEKSLRALNTDYLDFFFVHEPLEKLLYIDELALTAEKLKAEGKIRAWGLAYMKSQEYLHLSYLNAFDVLQFNNSPGNQEYERTVDVRGKRANVFFSPLRGGSTDLTPQEKLSKLFIDFPQSVVLCSMFKESHIKANALLV